MIILDKLQFLRRAHYARPPIQRIFEPNNAIGILVPLVAIPAKRLCAQSRLDRCYHIYKLRNSRLCNRLRRQVFGHFFDHDVDVKRPHRLVGRNPGVNHSLSFGQAPDVAQRQRVTFIGFGIRFAVRRPFYAGFEPVGRITLAFLAKAIPAQCLRAHSRTGSGDCLAKVGELFFRYLVALGILGEKFHH